MFSHLMRANSIHFSTPTQNYSEMVGEMDTRKGGSRGGYKVATKGHSHSSWKKSNLHCNLPSHYSLAAFICVFMFPYLTDHSVLTSFPYVWASLCNPKCLFVVVNVIVIFLVGESRAGASTGTASPVNEIYEEYVKRGRRMKMKKLPRDQEERKRAEAAGERLVMIRGGTEEEKEIGEKMVVENEEEVKGEEKQKEVEKKVVHENEEEGEEDKHKEKRKDEEEEGKEMLVIGEDEEGKNGKEKKEKQDKEGASEQMPREELNMRVEAFIARVNRQRRMESRLVSVRPAS